MRARLIMKVQFIFVSIGVGLCQEAPVALQGEHVQTDDASACHTCSDEDNVGMLQFGKKGGRDDSRLVEEISDEVTDGEDKEHEGNNAEERWNILTGLQGTGSFTGFSLEAASKTLSVYTDDENNFAPKFLPKELGARIDEPYDISYIKFDHPQIKGPVIFIMHGRMSNWDQMKTVGQELGCRGYTAILFDHINHGTRKHSLFGKNSKGGYGGHSGVPDWGGGNTYYGEQMYEVMQLSAAEIQQMIDKIKASEAGGLEADRFGVFGESMGGHASQYAFVHYKDLSIHGSFVSMGNYTKYFQDKACKSCSAWRDRFPVGPLPDCDGCTRTDAPDLQGVVDAMDPVNNLQKFGGRPWFAMNGGSDSLVPGTLNEALVAKIRSEGLYNKNPESLQWYSVPGGRHGASGNSKDSSAGGWHNTDRYHMYNFFEQHFPVNRQTGIMPAEGFYRIAEAHGHRHLYVGNSWDGHHYMRAVDISRSCFDWAWKWKVSQVPDTSTYYLYNVDEKKYACAKSDGYVQMYSSDISQSCKWKIQQHPDQEGRYQLLNTKYEGKLFRHLSTTLQPRAVVYYHKMQLKLQDTSMPTGHAAGTVGAYADASASASARFSYPSVKDLFIFTRAVE